MMIIGVKFLQIVGGAHGPFPSPSLSSLTLPSPLPSPLLRSRAPPNPARGSGGAL